MLPAMRHFALVAALACAAHAKEPAMSLHELTAPNIDGKPTSLAEYKGKVVLVVNVASQCGYTPQYTGLEKLWQDYKAKGVVVVGFPSNDFGAQEPGTEAEIKTFCSTKYSVTFPLFAKVKTHGDGQSPVYRFLTAKHGEPKWNFHKYIVGKDGQVRAAFPSKIAPDDAQIRAALDAALAQ
jgi:glutathione peroxidase